MTEAERRRFYQWFLPTISVVVAGLWFTLQGTIPAIRWVFPGVVVFLVCDYLAIRRDWRPIEFLERVAFWVMTAVEVAFAAVTMALTSAPASFWPGLLPTIFLSMILQVAMAYLFWPGHTALRLSLLLPAVMLFLLVPYLLRYRNDVGIPMIEFVGAYISVGAVIAVVHTLSLSKAAFIQAELDTRRMLALAQFDPLTGLANRRHALAELHRLTAADGPVTVVIFDLDHFKEVNDTYGHDIGDEVLVQVASLLRDAVTRGACDMAARWGGEEFVLAIAEPRDVALVRLHEFRQLVGNFRFSFGIRVTASFGAASVSRTASVDIALREADLSLYEAKRSGRDAVRFNLKAR